MHEGRVAHNACLGGSGSRVAVGAEAPTVAPMETSMLFSSFESTIFEPNRMLRQDTAIPSVPAATPADRIRYASTNVGVEHARSHGVTRCWPLSYASECERCFVFDNIVPVQNVFENTTPERPGHEDHECMHVWDGWSLGRDLPRGNLLQRAKVVLPGRRNSPGEFVGHRHHTLRRPPPLWAHAQHCTPPTNPRPCHRHQLSLYCL